MESNNNNIDRNEWEKKVKINKVNKEQLRINFRVILVEFLRIARLRSDLCNSYKKNGVSDSEKN